MLYVSSNGTYGGKTTCYDTIQKAVNAATTGSIILIAEGTYNESITLSEVKSLTLSGGWNTDFTAQAANKTIIKAPKTTKGALTFQDSIIRP